MTAPDQGAAPQVSVVIPARNAARTIDAQLGALADQDYDGAIEVIVADNGSTDDTARRARAWGDRLPGLRVVDATDRAGPAHARNVGIAAATSDLVLCCDADDVVDRSWVRLLVAALATADAVAGGTVDFRRDPPANPPPPRPFGTAGFGFLPALMSCSCGLRRAAWEAVGGFDEDFVTCEDIDLAWRIQRAGFTLVQVPDAFVYYREPGTARDVVRAWFRYGRFQPLLMQRFGPDGLHRDRSVRVLAAWGRLALTCYRVAGNDSARRTWCRDLGRRMGRIVGSIRTRTLYL